MKAIVYTEYGNPDVLQLKEVEKPVPKDNEVLIRICATTVNFGDIMARNFRKVSLSEFSMPFVLWVVTKIMFGFSKPKIKILGSQFAGEIEVTGKNVDQFKKGGQVFGYRGPKFGAYAEYLCMPAKGLVALKPNNLTYEEAATVPYGAITALNLLRAVHLQKGQKILIVGASGGIGSAAVQLAKYFELEVTGVCATPRIEFVKSLGADNIIDYKKEDFTKNGETYDVIFDILGKSTFLRCKKSLKQNGKYLLASFKTKQLLQMLWTKIKGGKQVICTLSNEKVEDLVFINNLIEEGKIITIIDKIFPLEKAADAHRYVKDGKRTGNVVIHI